MTPRQCKPLLALWQPEQKLQKKKGRRKLHPPWLTKLACPHWRACWRTIADGHLEKRTLRGAGWLCVSFENSSTFNGLENFLRTCASECCSIGTFAFIYKLMATFGSAVGGPGAVTLHNAVHAQCTWAAAQTCTPCCAVALCSAPTWHSLSVTARWLEKTLQPQLEVLLRGVFLSLPAGTAGLRFIAYVHPKLPALPLLNPRTARRQLLLFLSERWLKSRTEHVGDWSGRF